MKSLRSKFFYFIITLIVFGLPGCEEKDKAPLLSLEFMPQVLSPQNDTTFYPDQLISIKWKVPDSTQTVELQLLSSNDIKYFNNAQKLFDTTNFVLRISNLSSQEFMHDSQLEKKTYYAFRLRYRENGIPSEWTAIQYFNVFPYSSLETKYITIKSEFDFIAGHNPNTIHSGLARSVSKVNLDHEIMTKGFDLSKLLFIKLDSGFVKDESVYGAHIESMSFGFSEDSELSRPFNSFGGVSTLKYRPPITFAPFGGKYRDMYVEIGKSSPYMDAAYRLSNNFKKEEEIGKRHLVKVNLRLKCYFKKW